MLCKFKIGQGELGHLREIVEGESTGTAICVFALDNPTFAEYQEIEVRLPTPKLFEYSFGQRLVMRLKEVWRLLREDI